MEIISLKLDEAMLHNMDSVLKSNNYSTRTEFIRSAIRNKLEEIEKKEFVKKEFMKFYGKAEKKTTVQENRKTREEVFNKFIKEKGWNI